MKKKISIVLAGILFLAGLSLLLYPLVANQWNNYRQSKLISEYETVVKDESRKGTINYEKEWERANAYNQSLLPSILPDSFAIAAASDEPGEEYMSCLNILTDEMMGYVEIPKINIKIPIFHTTSEEVLSKGAGHLEGSSLPVGGENTHSVISAHRGLPSASLFTDLDQLEDGDHFLIRVLDQTLCYEVDQIHIVEPENTSDLAVEAGTGSGNSSDLYSICGQHETSSGKRSPGTIRGGDHQGRGERITDEPVYQLSALGTGRLGGNRSTDHFLMAV